jgi:hypothetical protein
MNLKLERIDKPIKTIGSFDIGIKNLSLCILDRTTNSPFFRIHKWELISLVNAHKKLKCCKIIRNGKSKCMKNANVIDSVTNRGYCKIHKPDDNINLKRYLTTKNITDLELNEKIIEVLNKYPELWTRCDEIVLESQMRSGMKQIVWMIFSYLTSKKLDTVGTLKNIKIISAKHKLAIPKELLPIALPVGDKSTYDGRKDLAMIHCPILLKHCEPYYLQFFNEHEKKDDLADAFLQGLWCILKD